MKETLEYEAELVTSDPLIPNGKVLDQDEGDLQEEYKWWRHPIAFFKFKLLFLFATTKSLFYFRSFR